MVVKKLKPSDLTDLGTKQRILEVAINLFALKGFDGASIREIAQLAGVNVASVNYHFKSKENLRQKLMEFIMENFRSRISSIPEVKSTAEYAVKLFETLSHDSAQCLNQFKLFLGAENNQCAMEPSPVGWEQFSFYLDKELNKKVPHDERMWLVNVAFSYIVHTSVMSSTEVGKKNIERFFPKKRASLPIYITQLVDTLIRDLNHRYS